MATYSIRTVAGSTNREIRIYPVSVTSTVTATDQFVSLDSLGLSKGIILKGWLDVSCVGAISYAGMVDLNLQEGIEITTPEGRKATVESLQELDEFLIEENIKVIELQPYVKEEA